MCKDRIFLKEVDKYKRVFCSGQCNAQCLKETRKYLSYADLISLLMFSSQYSDESCSQWLLYLYCISGCLLTVFSNRTEEAKEFFFFKSVISR